LDVHAFKCLPRGLTKLNLSYYPVSVPELQGIPTIEELNLSHCGVDDNLLKYLPGTITVLNLSLNPLITSDGLRYLPNSLTSLDLRHCTKLKGQGVRRVLTSLPFLEKLKLY